MRRLAVVVIVSLAGFAAAFMAFGDAARGGCVVQAPEDDAYAAEFEEAVRAGEGTHVLRVTRHGEPVTGARVCVNVEMAGMSGMSASAEGREVASGRYEMPLRLPMAGEWTGTALIADETGDADVAAVPLAFDVLEAAP